VSRRSSRVRSLGTGVAAFGTEPALAVEVLEHPAAPARSTSTSVASALVELLEPWVGQAFNVAGAANMPFIAAWSERGLPWFTALEEKRGLLMAEGYARASGRLALMTTTAGPGVTNLATGLFVALRERSPVLVVSGQTPAAYAARLPVQELDTKSFVRDLTLKARELTAPEPLEGFVSELIRTALEPSRRGPVLLAVPADLWQRPCRLRDAVRFPEPWSPAAARRCARALVEASQPLVIAGSGVVQAGVTRALCELVELLPHARVATTPRALGAFPASHAQSIQSLGFGGSVDTELDEADLLLVLGSRLHELSTNFDERLYTKKILQLDLDPAAIGVAFPAEGYIAELRLALAEIASAVLHEPRALRSFASPPSFGVEP